METKNLSTFEKTWGVLIPILVYKISTAFFAMVLLTLTDTLSRHGLIPSTVLSENSGFLSVLIRAISLTLSIAVLFTSYVKTMQTKQCSATESTDNTDSKHRTYLLDPNDENNTIIPAKITNSLIGY